MPSPLIQQLMGNAQQNQQNALAGSIDMANQAGANRYAAQQQLLQMQHEFDLSKMAQAHQYGMESDAQKQAAMLADAQGKLLDRPVTPGGTTGLKYGLDPATGQINASTGKTDAGLLNTPFETAADPAALGQQMAQKFNTEAATKATTPQQAAAPTMDHFAALGQAMSGNPFGAAASALQGSKEGDAAFLQNKQAALPETIGYMSSLMRPTGTALEKEQAGQTQRTKMQSDAMLRAKQLEAAQLKNAEVYKAIAAGGATPESVAGTVGAIADASRLYGLDKLGESAPGAPTGTLPQEGEAALLGNKPSTPMADTEESLRKHLLQKSDTYSTAELDAALGKLSDPDSFMEAIRGNRHLQTPYAAQAMIQKMAALGNAPSDVEKALAERIAYNASQTGDMGNAVGPGGNHPAVYGGMQVIPTGTELGETSSRGVKVATPKGHYWLNNNRPIDRFTDWLPSWKSAENLRLMREKNQATAAFMEALMGQR